MENLPTWHSAGRTVATLTLAAAGAGAATLVSFPAALLTGSALVVSCAGLSGLRMEIDVRLRDLAFLIIGVGIGSTVSPDTLTVMGQLPLAFVALLALLAVMMLVSQTLLQRFFGFGSRSAVLAAAPGHLSFVIGLSVEQGVDTVRVTVVQAVRLLALTLIVPLFASAMGVEIVGNPLAGRTAMPWPQFLALIGISLAFGLALQRFRLPAALLIAAMVVSGLVHALGWVHGGLNPTLGTVSFITVGALIGTRFSGMGFAALRSGLFAGLTITLIASALAVGAALPVAMVLSLDQPTVLAAFAPGGFETMVALGAVLGANPGFVAAAHVARLMFLTGLIPLMLGRARRAAS